MSSRRRWKPAWPCFVELELECDVDCSLGSFTSAFLELHVGAGGEDACDWTRMLLSMYTSFAQKMNWKCKLISKLDEGASCHSSAAAIARKIINGINNTLRFIRPPAQFFADSRAYDSEDQTDTAVRPTPSSARPPKSSEQMVCSKDARPTRRFPALHRARRTGHA